MPTCTTKTLLKMKQQGEKIACLTAYDASFTAILNKAGIDFILVGDSLGMVFQGHETTIPTTIDHIVYHTTCVAKTNQYALLTADMPFMSYSTPLDALTNAKKLMQAGAHMVKLEGGQWLTETVYQLSERGISVCAHIGLTPQSVHKMGGYRIQGREEDHAKQLIDDAISLQQAGAQSIVLEGIPASLSHDITSKLDIPTIGIGAGLECDGQILVLYDLLGISTGRIPKFAKQFLSQDYPNILSAVQAYIFAVKQQQFPQSSHWVE